MHAIAPEAYNSYPFFGERGMLHRQLATASVRTAGACKLLYIYRHNFGRFLHLVPDFASRVKFVAETRVKLNALRDQQVEAAGERSRALEQGYEAAVVTELLNQPSMRRCCGVVTLCPRSQQAARGASDQARCGIGARAAWALPRSGPPVEAERRARGHVGACPERFFSPIHPGAPFEPRRRSCNSSMRTASTWPLEIQAASTRT